jgi:hypothetical protein
LLAEDKKPLFVSHAYKGDKSHQNAVEQYIKGTYSRFSINASPWAAKNAQKPTTEISMRTRSLNFLAFSVLGAYAVQEVNQLNDVTLYVPENGFISLNAPLTPRRIGSLSTRTTHPYFLSETQDIFRKIGIFVTIKNPYQFKTKGEMINSCQDKSIISSMIPHTVSCSHWKREKIQCGYCIPCLIRRSAIKKGNIKNIDSYKVKNIKAILRNEKYKDDIFALYNAFYQLEHRNISTWIMESGFLPETQLDNFKSMFIRGLSEVKAFLDQEIKL